MYALKNYEKTKNRAQAPTRLGITVNKKLGKAVRRSRVKRVIRAAYRQNLPDLKNGYLIIVAARGAVFEKNVKSTAVAERMRQSFEKLGLLSGMPDIRPNAAKQSKKPFGRENHENTLYFFDTALPEISISAQRHTNLPFYADLLGICAGSLSGARAFLSARHSAFGVCFGAIRSERAAMIPCRRKESAST